MSSYGLAEFLKEVEADIAWREAEIRILERSIQNERDLNTINALRRAFITLLYAHAEGGVKTALGCYIRVINSECLAVNNCLPTIVVAAWSDLFKAMSEQGKSHDFFRSRLPENKKIHRFARQAEFVSNIRTFEVLPVEIDHLKILDTESNLDEVVLVKILYQLGFSPDILSGKFRELHFLRELRNYIAHGEKVIPTPAHCLKYRTTVMELFPKLRDLLAKAIRQKSYMRVS